jgi:ERCC4-type nuclease
MDKKYRKTNNPAQCVEMIQDLIAKYREDEKRYETQPKSMGEDMIYSSVKHEMEQFMANIEEILYH